MQTLSSHITQDQADEIVLGSLHADDVEECEENEVGFVYTLTDGSAFVVSYSGETWLETYEG